MANLKEHEKRVELEKDDLGDNIYKLKNFIESEKFKTVDHDQQVLLIKQLGFMESYHQTLVERIDIFYRG